MAEMHPLLDLKIQQTAKEYETKKRSIALLGNALSSIAALLFIFFIQIPLLSHLPTISFLKFLFFIWIYSAFFIPFDCLISYLSSYRLEHRYGFSNQTASRFWIDRLKEQLISFVITPLISGIIIFMMLTFPQYWWLASALGLMIISTFFATIFPVVILPMFNKYEPVEDEILKNKLKIILKKSGLKVKGFFVQDMSRQTKKENAFLAGIGHTRRVVLSDNILNNMNPDELETVIAHEAGHYRHHHMLHQIIISALAQCMLFFILNKLCILLFPGFQFNITTVLSVFPAFMLGFSILSLFFISPLQNALSRYFEKQADEYALNVTGKPNAFMTAMAGLADRNLSNAYPPKWLKIMFYSHPPVGERLKHGEHYKLKESE